MQLRSPGRSAGHALTGESQLASVVEAMANRPSPGEEPTEAIRREIEEETGWRPGHITPMTSYNALSGISTMRFSSFHATECTHIGAPSDPSESS
jgi:ADP-ribose pyrophosphatase YjhB (NUDIX family)